MHESDERASWRATRMLVLPLPVPTPLLLPPFSLLQVLITFICE